MRKHGWELPYHPLQVVAVAVFLALGFAFYVFFAPFVGRKLLQYIAMGLYTPLILLVSGLYIWCCATDPADPGVFKSKKYCKMLHEGKHSQTKELKLASESTASLIRDENAVTVGEMRPIDEKLIGVGASTDIPITGTDKGNAHSCHSSRLISLLAMFPCVCLCNCSNSHGKSDQQMSEDGMFYCSLCEVEVFKYSKHCRVCDKCVDRYDHHCRWLNNCVGRRNYRQFFTLMVSALILVYVHLGLEIAAYSSVVVWNLCTHLLFS